MTKERIPLLVGGAGVLLLLIGIIGGAIEGRLGPLFLTPLIVGLAAVLLALYTSGGVVRTWMSRRSTRYGANMAIMIVVAFAIVIFVETLSYHYYKQFDVTGDRLNSLSAQTVQILKGLAKGDKKVQVTAFVRDSARKGYRDLLDLYTYETDRLKYELIDLDKNPLLAKKFEVRAYGTLMIESGENSQKVEIPGEQQIANAILRVTRTSKKTVYFLKGHGEADISDTKKEGFPRPSGPSSWKTSWSRTSFSFGPRKSPRTPRSLSSPAPRSPSLRPSGRCWTITSGSGREVSCFSSIHRRIPSWKAS